jgi:hypothetical protein
MSALIGVRIELRDAHGKLVGAVYCEDQFVIGAGPVHLCGLDTAQRG